MPALSSLCYDSLVATPRWEIGVSIQSPFRTQVKAAWLRKIARGVLTAKDLEGEGEVSLVITGDKEIQELSRRYHGTDKTTDVLSFPLGQDSPMSLESGENAFIQPPGSPRALGEVFISYHRAVEQAKEFKSTPEEEVALLTVHGLLHLLGYDHADAKGESSMREEETRILRALGYAAPTLAEHYKGAS